MNINKHQHFFDPLKIEDTIHIIGVGAIGSNLAVMLARLGLQDFKIYDFDEVEPKNVANQAYFDDQIGKPKTEAIVETMKRINPDADIEIVHDGWEPDTALNGFVFLCLDNIDLRRQIVEENKLNPRIRAIFDFRMGLDSAQHYCANLMSEREKNLKRLLGTMDFTHEEAKEVLPTSPCGTTLAILPTIWTIISAGVANFINLVKTGTCKHTILCNPFASLVDAF